MADNPLSIFALNRKSKGFVITCDHIDLFVKEKHTKEEERDWTLSSVSVIDVLFDIVSGNLDDLLSPDPTEATKTKRYSSKVIGDLLAKESLQSLLPMDTGR